MATIWQHIKEQTLIEKRPRNLEGRFSVFARKYRNFRRFQAFSISDNRSRGGHKSKILCISYVG